MIVISLMALDYFLSLRVPFAKNSSARQGSMFPKTFITRVCSPNVFQFAVNFEYISTIIRA